MCIIQPKKKGGLTLTSDKEIPSLPKSTINVGGLSLTSTTSLVTTIELARVGVPSSLASTVKLYVVIVS